MRHPVVQAIEQEQLQKGIPNFSTGDTIAVYVKVKEGKRERVQTYEGVVIARRNRGLHSAVTVRKMAHGSGVERVFPLHSPLIDKIEVKRFGKMRKAKAYHLRELTGKAARIKEDLGQAVKAKAAAKAANATNAGDNETTAE